MSTLGYVLMTVSYWLFALIIYYIEQAFVALAELGDDSKSVHESFNYLSTATLDYIATTYLYHKTGNQTEYYYKKSYHFDQIVDMFGEEMIEERMEKIDSFGVNALSSYKEKHKEQMSTK